jgi:DNA-binding beta-propeller fold protein YncE
MAKNRVLLVLEVVLLLVCISSLVSCGSSRASFPATPAATAPQRLDTGPLGLPLYCPQYITHDQQGNIYVGDNYLGKTTPHARIVKLSPTGQLLGEWHVFTAFHGIPSGPFGLAVDAQGTIYVADAGDNTIKKLSPTGQLLATWGKTGSAPGELDWPQGVALDPQGNVYVADFNNSRIEKFSSTGTLLAVFGNTGSSTERLRNPVGITIDAQGTIYVSDIRHHRMVKFSPEGKFLLAWYGAGSKSFSSAKDVAVDSEGNVYTADSLTHRILKFSPTGKVLAIWERPLDFNNGITVDLQGNIYFVANLQRGGGAIRKLSPSGALLSSWPAKCSAFS